MRKLFQIAFCFLLLIALTGSVIPAMAAGEEPDITDNFLTGSLNAETDVRWYRFQVTEEGDAVIAFHAEKAGSKPFNWEIAIYAQDQTTRLEAKNVGKGYSFLAANDLPVGTYYASVRMAQNNDPDTMPDRIGFCGNPYSVKVLTCASPRAEVGENGLLVVSEPATVLCVLDGSIYVKTDEEQVLVGLYTNHDGKTAPMIVAINQNKIDGGSYFSSQTNHAYFFHRSEYVSYDDGSDSLRYLYTPAVSAQGTAADPLLPKLYVCGEGQRMNEERAVKEMLNVHFGKDPNEGLDFLIFMDSPAMPFVIGGVVLVIVLVAFLVWLYHKRLYRREPWRNPATRDVSDTETSSTGSDITWYDGKPWTPDHSNAKDV